MPRFYLSLTFFSVLMGCATTAKYDSRAERRLTPPPTSFLHKYSNASLSDLEKIPLGEQENNLMWWKTYTLSLRLKDARSNTACEGFKFLAKTPDFPLHDLALLRSYETCLDHKDLPEFPEEVAPWYRELFVESKLRLAQTTPDIKDDLIALIEKARLENQKKNKEDIYLKALLLAQKLEDKEHTSELQALLYKNSPRLNPLPTYQDLSAIAGDFRFHRDFDKALKTYRQILDSKEASTEDQFQALKNIRQTLKVAQKRNEYINATADLVTWARAQFNKNKKDKKTLSRFHDSQILFAKTLWTEDQTSRAVQVLNETHKMLRGSYPMDEVFFILGRIDEEKGNFIKALEYFEASYAEPISFPSLREKIAWLKSWNYFKLQKYEEARSSFKQMKEQAKDPSDQARASFWLGRTLKSLNKISEAQKEWEDLIKADPLGFYGVMAHRDLQKSFSPLRVQGKDLEELSLLSLKEIDPQIRLVAEWLIAVQEKSFAEKILNSAFEDLKKRNVNSEDTWLAMFSGYARTGLYLPLFSALGSLDAKVKDRLLNDHPDLLFPKPYADIIKNASDKSGTAQEFIYSIIRQESAFNPEARSPVDAFGLMQLLPSVAQQLAKKNNLEYRETNDLFRPEINIPLGAYELKSLMNKYNGQFILAVSGYNANDSAIRGWLKTRFRDDPLEFIEEVPYEETRAYIKLTMRNYVFYRRLLDQVESLRFPEELLKLSKVSP